MIFQSHDRHVSVSHVDYFGVRKQPLQLMPIVMNHDTAIQRQSLTGRPTFERPQSTHDVTVHCISTSMEKCA